jgi:ribosomal protein S13
MPRKEALKDPEMVKLANKLPPVVKELRIVEIEGIDRHLVGPDWDIQVKFDIKKEIELNTWRGIRHKLGLPVRGQCTKAHHRRSKRPIGVQRKA